MYREFIFGGYHDDERILIIEDHHYRQRNIKNAHSKSHLHIIKQCKEMKKNDLREIVANSNERK